MRIHIDTIKEEGEKISPHSKYYIWGDMLFEPVFYNGKKCKTYKVITDINKINKVMSRKKQLELIPTISSVCGVKSSRKNRKEVTSRFEILDIRRK